MTHQQHIANTSLTARKQTEGTENGDRNIERPKRGLRGSKGRGEGEKKGRRARKKTVRHT